MQVDTAIDCPWPRARAALATQATRWTQLLLCLGCLGVWLLESPLRAQDAAPTPAADVPSTPTVAPARSKLNLPSSAPTERGPTDAAELEAFVDGVMAAHLKDKHIAGATFAFVADNQLFFAKGYGFADVARKKPVDPDETMFRIGSVSKLFTWTAVMQLF